MLIVKNNSYFIFFTAAFVVLIFWVFYIIKNDLFILFSDYWFMTVVMIFGSFIAGASSEGGGAIAYPVMTLFFNIDPNVARDFSFAIQSVGMSFASLWIFLSKVKIDTTYLRVAGIGGLAGIIIGSWFIAPFVQPSYAKMMFVSFWLSFGIALWVVNYTQDKKYVESIPGLNFLQKTQLFAVVIFGAPLGAYTITRIGRKPIAAILISIIVIQFISALIIIKPGLTLLIFSFVIFLTGVVLFFILASYRKN